MGSLEGAIMTGFICRLCSKMNHCVIHMYGEEGRRLKLVSRIKEYLPVKIEPNDPLPKTICRLCIYRLQCHHKLMRQITIARKRLNQKILERQLIQMETVQERVHVFQREGTPPPNNYISNSSDSRQSIPTSNVINDNNIPSSANSIENITSDNAIINNVLPNNNNTTINNNIPENTVNRTNSNTNINSQSDNPIFSNFSDSPNRFSPNQIMMDTERVIDSILNV